MIAAILTLFSTDAHAVDYTVDFCVEYATNFQDLGGDFWTSNVNRAARGIHLVVERTSGFDIFNDYTDSSGCVEVILSDAHDYYVYSVSKAETNGVETLVYDDEASPAHYAWTHYWTGNPFDPALSDGSETVVVTATTGSAMLAIGSTTMWVNNLGLGSSTPLTYYDDDCCFASDKIKASTFSKTKIGHETGHGIGYRREGNNDPNFEYDAAEDGCDGVGVAVGQHAQLTKEWQSAAFIEGFADVISAYLWNDETQADCTYDRHHTSDYDLDGVDDDGAVAGQVNCEGIPATGLEAYVTARDWLVDVVNADDDDVDAVQCSGLTTSRGAQLDFLRYGWDMLNDEAVPIEHFVDIYDNAQPQNWDADDNTALSDGSTTTFDDVIVRWEASADTHPVDIDGYEAEHDDQKDQGLDH